VNNCTGGHTYFPIMRVRVFGDAWGPWAGAHQFVC
jgi:hypothetical protein